MNASQPEQSHPADQEAPASTEKTKRPAHPDRRGGARIAAVKAKATQIRRTARERKGKAHNKTDRAPARKGVTHLTTEVQNKAGHLADKARKSAASGDHAPTVRRSAGTVLGLGTLVAAAAWIRRRTRPTKQKPAWWRIVRGPKK
jgi:hypothetical protein